MKEKNIFFDSGPMAGVYEFIKINELLKLNMLDKKELDELLFIYKDKNGEPIIQINLMTKRQARHLMNNFYPKEIYKSRRKQ